MIAPESGKLVHHRQQAVAVCRHHLDGKIVVNKRPRETGKGNADEAEHTHRQPGRERHRRDISPPGPPQRDCRQQSGEPEGNYQRKMAQFRNHCVCLYGQNPIA